MGPPNLHIFRGFYGKSPGFLGMAKTMTILSTIHGVEPHLSKAGWVDQGTRQVGVAGAPRHRWGTVGTETELGIWWPTWLWQWKHSNEKWTCWRCISYWTWRYSSTILLMVQKSGVRQLIFCSLSQCLQVSLYRWCRISSINSSWVWNLVKFFGFGQWRICCVLLGVKGWYFIIEVNTKFL